MEKPLDILVFGSLSKDFGIPAGEPFPCAILGPTPLTELLTRLSIALWQVELVMVNHRAVFGDYVIQPGDRVALFPPDYMIFADWKDFRLTGPSPTLPPKDP